MNIIDIALASVVVGLAGWALVQSGGEKPERRGGCGCSSASCGPQPQEGDALVTLGGESDEAEQAGRERR